MCALTKPFRRTFCLSSYFELNSYVLLHSMPTIPFYLVFFSAGSLHFIFSGRLFFDDMIRTFDSENIDLMENVSCKLQLSGSRDATVAVFQKLIIMGAVCSALLGILCYHCATSNGATFLLFTACRIRTVLVRFNTIFSASIAAAKRFWK